MRIWRGQDDCIKACDFIFGEFSVKNVSILTSEILEYDSYWCCCIRCIRCGKVPLPLYKSVGEVLCWTREVVASWSISCAAPDCTRFAGVDVWRCDRKYWNFIVGSFVAHTHRYSLYEPIFWNEAARWFGRFHSPHRRQLRWAMMTELSSLVFKSEKSNTIKLHSWKFHFLHIIIYYYYYWVSTISFDKYVDLLLLHRNSKLLLLHHDKWALGTWSTEKRRGIDIDVQMTYVADATSVSDLGLSSLAATAIIIDEDEAKFRWLSDMKTNGKRSVALMNFLMR